MERAAALCEALFELAPDSLAQGAVFALKTRILEYRGKLLEAVATIRAGLRLFGVELPEAREDIDRGIGEGIQKMQRHLAQVPVEQLASLPELRDAERVMTLELLFQVIPPAIQTHPPLFVLAELLMFDIALSHGVTQLSCKNFVDCGIIQGGILGDYEVAYRLGQTALNMLERYRPTPLESSVPFVFSAFVSHFKRPVREGFALYERAARAGLELGDVQHLAYATVHRAHRSLLVGVRLLECEQEAKDALRFLEGARAAGQLVGMLVSTWSLARLQGSETLQLSAGRTEEEVLQTLEHAGNAQWLFSFGQAQTWVSYLLGDLTEAARWQTFTDAYAPAGVGLFAEVDYQLFRALLRLESPEQSASDREQLDRAHDKLRRWAASCPENFAHKLALFEAELSRATARPLGEVLAHYEAALTATGGDFLPFAALIHERQGRYLASTGQTHLARSSLQRAFQLYQAWGATAKLSRLTRELPESSPATSALALRPHRSDSATTRTKLDLDLVSVLKATRAISSEVEPEKLFRALMDAIIENAGAEVGCLVLCDDPDRPPEVRAWAAVDEAVAAALRTGPLATAERVCRDAVRYVIRSHESLVLDDAMTSGAFTGDAYVKQQGVRSLLCVPVLNRGALLAVLYAENNATRSAFTRARIETASVIASQAAISLSNALLYQSLEQKVCERTRELGEKNREIAAMLDGMEQGIFTIDDQLRIQPQFSAHLEKLLGTRCLSGERFGPLLFRGASLRPDQIAATESALRFCFDAPAFLAEANLAHAVRGFEVPSTDGEAKFFEVDWNLVVDATERVQKILVAVRDVTLLRRLTELAQRREREADIIGQILDSGLDRFREFRASAARRLEQCQRLLESEAPLEPEAVATLFRDAHTIKGNARLYGYSHLVDAVHELEDGYSELRAGRSQTVTRAELSKDLERVAELLRQYEELCEQKLGPLSQTRDSRLEQVERELRALLRDGPGQGDPASTLTRIAHALDRLSATPLTELVKETSRMLPSLAEELGKSVPLVECHDVERTHLDRSAADVLREVLIHAFRNSVDHGIERADERRARGKQPQGKVKLLAERRRDAVLLRLSDDGRGLPLDELRLRTGLTEAGDEELAETVFASGVSTASAVSPVSGRGVGMELIRGAARQLGGDARIAFTAPREQGHRPFELLVSLPMAR